jgi:hypothetical protein
MAQMLTQYSSHANTIADTVRAAFAKTKVGDCTVEMTAPEGSTQGGKLALQHITLRPADAPSALVIGSLNAGEKRAEIRAFSEVAAVHETRFKKAAAFDRSLYASFVNELAEVLLAFGIEAVRAEEPAESIVAEAPAAPSVRVESPLKADDDIALPMSTPSPMAKLAGLAAFALALFATVIWVWVRE